MTSESKHVYAWGSVLGEVLAVLLGVWITTRGWTGFGLILVATGVIGLVASATRLRRILRPHPDDTML